MNGGKEVLIFHSPVLITIQSAEGQFAEWATFSVKNDENVFSSSEMFLRSTRRARWNAVCPKCFSMRLNSVTKIRFNTFASSFMALAKRVIRNFVRWSNVSKICVKPVEQFSKLISKAMSSKTKFIVSCVKLRHSIDRSIERKVSMCLGISSGVLARRFAHGCEKKRDARGRDDPTGRFSF